MSAGLAATAVDMLSSFVRMIPPSEDPSALCIGLSTLSFVARQRKHPVSLRGGSAGTWALVE